MRNGSLSVMVRRKRSLRWASSRAAVISAWAWRACSAALRSVASRRLVLRPMPNAASPSAPHTPASSRASQKMRSRQSASVSVIEMPTDTTSG